MSQSTINQNKNCFNTTNSFYNVWNYSVADNRSELLTRLSPLEPVLRHRDVQEHRVDNVGEWLMETQEFERWCDRGGEGGDHKRVLFCYGDPGVGKTFIGSLVVDRLCDQAAGRNTAVTCFYFDFAARKEQFVTSMLGSLLRQIVNGMERIPEEIYRAFRDQAKAIGGRGPQLSDLVEMLQTIASRQRIFICIDALDECAAGHRVKLLDSLNQILEKSPDTRIFVTGRPHIKPEIERRLAGRVASVSVGPRKDDIIRYLRARPDEDETPDAMDESLEPEILQKIPENVSEMFLLVSLNIEAILQESTVYGRREKLGRMTDGLGLGDAYDATIERIKAQGGDKSRLGLGALMWISHAERPLRADDLCHALAVKIGSSDFNADNIPSMSTLLARCQGLITVDKEASTVRLIHFTLQEYLSAHPDIFSGPHSVMADICLTYLNSERVRALSTNPPPVPRAIPFLEYCSLHWGAHAKRELSDYARSLALKLFQEYDSHISAELLAAEIQYFQYEPSCTWSPFSGLHCASFFGIAEVVAALIEMGCGDINGGDSSGYTPLAWAAHNGHEETVKILLGQEEVNPDRPSSRGQTPLSFAAQNGHEGAVRIFLGREQVNPDKPDNCDKTPLSFATCSRHEGVVKMLLERKDINPEKPDSYGQTPLLLAAEYGNEGTVGILLGHEDVNPDAADDYGRTPLSRAAWNGHEGVVKPLLGQEAVDPDSACDYGRTPLSSAAENGHEGVVKMLLAREEVDPNKQDNYGQTPLSIATRLGHKRVVALLQSHKWLPPARVDTWELPPSPPPFRSMLLAAVAHERHTLQTKEIP